DDTFEQRVARHAISAVQAGKRCFPNRIKILKVSMTIFIDKHAATGVMRCGNHRDGFPGNINSKIHTASFDCGEMLTNKFWRFMADIKEYKVAAQTFHLVIYRTGNNVAWR